MNVNEIMHEISLLPDTDKQFIKLKLMSFFPHSGKNPDTFLSDERFGSQGCHCPRCSSTHIRKNGHSKDGRQRYLCMDCGRTFGSRFQTFLAGTHKEPGVWEAYIGCMFEGYSLRRSAGVCGISLPTAFFWRHRILDALRGVLDRIRLRGVVEADETYLNVSYKGNHTDSEFKMPRPSRHRGGELHQSGISSELVCISCAVGQDGHSAAEAVTLGRASKDELAAFFRKHTDDSIILCTDHEPSYHAFAKTEGIRHIQLETMQVKEGYSIQRINAYHSRMKEFLARFHGVSTKYLNNYLAWNTAKDMVKERGAEEFLEKFEKVLLEPVYSVIRTFRDRSPVPLLTE